MSLNFRFLRIGKLNLIGWFAVFQLLAMLVNGAYCSINITPERDLIIKWKLKPSTLDALDLLPEYAAQVESLSPALPVSYYEDSGLERISVVKLKSIADIEPMLANLRRDPRLEYAEQRPIRYLDGFRQSDSHSRGSLDGIPDDPYYPQQWGFPVVQAEAAWDITSGNPNVSVAVVDLGVDFTHPELTRSHWENSAEVNGITGVDDDNNGYIDDFYGWDFMDMDGNPMPLNPDYSHGTHVAGVISAARNNGQGIAGIASNCKVMGVRAGDASIDFGYEGIYYACKSGAKIINCSWGGGSESAYEHDILNYVFDHGCVLVVSAGNSNTTVPHYPAAIEGVLSVASSDAGDYAAVFTNHGSWVKISAPGVAILSTIPVLDGIPRYATWQGTSMSAPLVAGICALVASRFPEMSGHQIMSRVLSSSDPIDQINPALAGMLGLGRINAWRSLSDSVTGVRLGDITYTELNGNGNGHIQPGETAELKISVYNDLNPISGVYGEISTSAADVVLTSPVSVYGDLSEGGPFWSGLPRFSLELPETSVRGRVIPLSVDWKNSEGRLIGRATRNVILDSTFVSIGNGYLTLGFSENGSLGYKDYVNDNYLGPGLRIEGRPTNALYHGSFVLAGDGTVLDNFYGNNALNMMDWQTAQDSLSYIVAPGGRADIEARASFNDQSSLNPLFATVNATALGWTASEINHFLILEYKITNISANPWNQTYAGLVFDWDLGSPDMNVGGFDQETNLAYVQQVIAGYPMVGLASITDSISSFFVANNRTDITDSTWGDHRKWLIMQSGIQAAPTVPMDLSEVISVGPISIAAHASYTVAFAIVVGQNVNELKTEAATARQHYQSAKKLIIEAKKADQLQMMLYPNPAPSGADLKLNLSPNQQASIKIYNILGQIVADIPNLQSNSGGALLKRELLNGASGLLFYRIESNSKVSVGKLLLLK